MTTHSKFLSKCYEEMFHLNFIFHIDISNIYSFDYSNFSKFALFLDMFILICIDFSLG